MHPTFNGSKLQRREHRSIKKAGKDNININIGNNISSTLSSNLSNNVNSNNKLVSGILNGREISPINLKTLEAPRLSQIYLPFLSK